MASSGIFAAACDFVVELIRRKIPKREKGLDFAGFRR